MINPLLSQIQQSILKNISDALVFIDLQGTILLFNEAAETLFGKSAHLVLFKKFTDHFADDAFGFSMKEALTFGTHHKLLYYKEWEVFTALILEGPKASQGIFILVKSLKEKRKEERTSFRNERLQELGSMLATAAHEIRNPLGAIRGYAYLLQKDLESFENLQEMTGFIIEGTKVLEKIVTRILHYSKPIELQLQTLDITTFLTRLARFIKKDPSFTPQIEMDLHIPNGPILMPFDPERLKSALINLLFNAIQAMPMGGKITFSLIQQESNCQICITDTGVGIAEEDLDYLFSPFYTTKQGGNGLGLVETQKIVKAHLGTIDVRSTLKKGSAFTITLPRIKR